MPSSYQGLWVGTVTFIAISVSLCIFGQLLRFGGRLTKGEASLMNCFVATGFLFMWMMWAMTWMSQANPILYPEVANSTGGSH